MPTRSLNQEEAKYLVLAVHGADRVAGEGRDVWLRRTQLRGMVRALRRPAGEDA